MRNGGRGGREGVCVGVEDVFGSGSVVEEEKKKKWREKDWKKNGQKKNKNIKIYIKKRIMGEEVLWDVSMTWRNGGQVRVGGGERGQERRERKWRMRRKQGKKKKQYKIYILLKLKNKI